LTLASGSDGNYATAMLDWLSWEPRERANLCFIVRGEEVLLIRKKRGLGAGKINAPGGKIDPGETALESAVRETAEEVGLVPLQPEARAELHFQFVDGYSLHCTVFVARGCEGEAIETDEAIPMWTPIDAIPYDEMWADDVHWLPRVLRGEKVTGWFEFDGERMTSIRIEPGVQDVVS
jgi:8-oxo-dGTP diphosphatase